MSRFASVTTKDELTALNTHLSSVSYIDGWTPSSTDADVFAKFKQPPSAKDYAHVARWYKHVESFSKDERAKWPKGALSSPVKNGAATSTSKAADDDEDIDLFGESDDEESEEKLKIKEERLAAYAAKKTAKPGPIAKSNVIFDVKPWEDTTDMVEMEKLVRAIQLDGLVWGSSKLMPVAFGIKKLQIGCAIEDDKVSTDWLEEQITGLEDYVQSVDIAAFQKI